jgi:hypothetical protein
MASRNELVIRANAVGITPSNYPNDSKLEQKVLYLEKNGTAFTGALGTQTFTIAGADVAAGDAIVIGNRTYTFRAALTGVKATGLITSDATDFADGETVSIDGVTYTFRTSLSNPVQKNEVLIGANVIASLDNLKLAINQGGAAWPTAADNSGAGSTWSVGTTQHPTVTATTNTNTTQLVEAKLPGVYANGKPLSETCVHAAWGAATLGTIVTSEVAGVNNGTDEVKIGSSAAETLDFLKDAINATAVTGAENTAYFVGGKAHEQVTATTNSNTQQVVAARNSALDNASIVTTAAGSGNIAAGAGTLASGVSTVIAANTTTSMGSAGVSGDKNLV